jgi:hypothetical protein
MITCENFTVVSVSSLFFLIPFSACILCATRLTGLYCILISLLPQRLHLVSGIPKLVLLQFLTPWHVLKDYLIVILSNCDRDMYIR